MDFSSFIESLRRREPEAYTWLVGHYARLIASVAGSRIPRKDSHLLEEVIQEVFISVMLAFEKKKLPEFLTESKFRNWLCQIARRRASEQYRKNRLNTLPLEDADSLAAREGTVEELLYRDELIIALHTALNELREIERAVVKARYIEGRSQEDTSRILMIPKGTVGSHLSRALTKLASSTAIQLVDVPSPE